LFQWKTTARLNANFFYVFRHFLVFQPILKDSLAEPLQIPTQLRHFSTTTTVGDWKFLLLAAIVSTRIPQLT
jgi:hypothetical protein